MKLPSIASRLPSWQSALLALLSAILLILAFPDFEYWFLAWFGLVPLLIAVELEKESVFRSFAVGWIWGVVFFFGTCWWLTYAPIHYAEFPPLLAYFLLFCVTAIVGIFPGLFAVISSRLLRQFGSVAFLAVPFVWVATEFARYWITGNDWNAIGYSQFSNFTFAKYATIGGVFTVSFVLVFYNLFARGLILIIVFIGAQVFYWFRRGKSAEKEITDQGLKGLDDRPKFSVSDDNPYELRNALFFAGLFVFYILLAWSMPHYSIGTPSANRVIAIQPNVPMSGLDEDKWRQLRQRQIDQAESALKKLETGNGKPATVVLPESPMNFMWTDDAEFRQFIADFAKRNNVSVLFNSAEPDLENRKYFNSAVMISPEGREVLEYDKIYLLPFGEAVPVPLDSILPGFVGNFSYGKNYNLVPLGDAKAGIMICFESHFGQLSREYVRRGADAIIEMTNDGYLGPTPVLRQHLANAVFRAIETNRPVLRVTNVGITAYITERGEIFDAAPTYTEDTRVWSVAKSDGSQTFYVKYGDWFAWLCTAVTLLVLAAAFLKRNNLRAAV